MAIFDFFKPKWQHTDPEVRRKALAALPDSEQSTLLHLAANDPAAEVRQAALQRISDWRLLEPLEGATAAAGDDLRRRIADLQLAEIFATHGPAKRELLAAVERESILAEIALRESDVEVRLEAVERIADPELLVEIATRNCGKTVGLQIVERLDDEASLRRLAREATSRAVRARAQDRLAALAAERQRPSLELRRREEFAAIAIRARQLGQASELTTALRECRELQRRWQELAEPTDDGGRLLDEACQLLEARRQEEAAREEARRVAEHQEAELRSQLEHIVAEIQSLARSAAPEAEARFDDLQAEWRRLLGLAAALPLATLPEAYSEAETAFRQSREVLATERGTAAELLSQLAAIEPLVVEHEAAAAEALSRVQRAFDDWRPRLISRQEVADCLAAARERQRAASANRVAAEAASREANVALRRGLVEELRQLLAAEDGRGVETRFKEIKAQWRASRELPAEELTALAADFAEVCRLLETRLISLRQEADWQRWQHKNIKLELIAAAEALDQLNDLHQVFKRIKELQESWRHTGPAPAKEENALWRRFQEATDRNYARCRDFFQTLEQEAEQHLMAKRCLVEQAVALQDSEDWQKTAESIKELQRQWKAIGRGPQDKETEVAQAFRAAGDHFFTRRKAHLATLDVVREANRGQKEELCRQAEELADQPELGHKARFQALQANWKAVGPAPKAQEEALWQRFRAAGDRYYAWLDTLRPDNLSRKEALCQEALTLTEGLGPETDFNRLAKKVVDLQRQWKEIGPVPKEQQEEVWQRFKGCCDRFYSVKQQHEAIIDQQRPANQARREALLARVMELTTATTVSREMVREVIAAQEEWQRLGPGDKGRDRQMQQDFKAAGDSFFRERREAMQEIDRLQRDNLKKREALCLRLEILAGLDQQPRPERMPSGRRGGLTLAEQLKVAFETNFVLAADDARDKRRRAKDEIEAVRKEWQQIGPVPREHEHAIRKRYQAALTAAEDLR